MSAIRAAVNVQVHPDTPLPELFRSYPETRAIFDRYGLRGCGGAHGPAESLSFFASAHGVALDTLIEQIQRVIADPQARQQARDQLDAHGHPHLADAIYRPFFLSAMAIMLTAGAAWGALLLWRIGFAGSFTGATVHEVNAHGHAQIMGWVGLFIMGFAYQAFPRMWRVELPAPKLAIAAWVAMLAGMTARSSAMMLDTTVWAGLVHLGGVVLEVGAVVVFLVQMATAYARSDEPVRPYVGFVASALVFFLVQTVFGGWHMARMMDASDRQAMLNQVTTFQAPLRDMQIHGMAMLMIFGVAMRMFPAIFSLPEVPDRRGWTALSLLLGGVWLEIVLFLLHRFSGHHLTAAALILPWSMLAIGCLTLIGPWRLWRPLPVVTHHERSGKFVRAAFAWLLVSLAMLLLLPFYQWLIAVEFSHAYYGAIRHAITVGFISMMIVGVAAKVVPTLRGIEPSKLPALWLPFALLNVGCLLRVSFQIGTDWHRVFFRMVGVSGVLEWTALALWACHMAAMMLGLGRYRQPVAANWGSPPPRILPEHRVAAVLSWYPQLETVFLEHGFHLIRHAILRHTLASQVSLRQACVMKGVDVEALLESLNRERAACQRRCTEDATQPTPLTVGGCRTVPRRTT